MKIVQGKALKNKRFVPRGSDILGSIDYGSFQVTYFRYGGKIYKVSKQFYPTPIECGLFERAGVYKYFVKGVEL